VIDCLSMQSEKLFAYITVRTSYFSTRWRRW